MQGTPLGNGAKVLQWPLGKPMRGQVSLNRISGARTLVLGSLAFACLAISFYYAINSILLGFTLRRGLPTYDLWVFVSDYLRYLDGSYSFFDLFSQHNEHRIATTRLILFADAILFGMRGVLPFTITYVALAMIAAGVAALTLGKTSPVAFLVAFATALGLAWSTAHWITMGLAFQVGLPLVHLLALATYAALALAITSHGTRQTQWLILSCTTDFLGVFSLGSGVAIALPALAMAVWLRKAGYALWIFLAVHLIFVACYLFNFTPDPRYGFPGVSAYFDYVAQTLGWACTDWQVPGGYFFLAVFLACTVAISWLAVALKKQIDPRLSILLALASFVVIEAMITAYGRSYVNPVTARYGLLSVVFILSLLAFLWRSTWFIKQGRIAARVAVLVAAVIVTTFANSPRYEADWREYARRVDEATSALRRGNFAHPTLETLRVHENRAERLIELGLGPFAAEE